MASVDFRKYNKSNIASLCVHFDTEKRKELGHSNKHIDKTRTDDNYFLGCNDYREMYNNVKNRVSDVDIIKPPKRVRKDRVIAVSAEIPCPIVLEKQGLVDSFFKFAYEQLETYFGKENVCGMTVHKDEKHEYVDRGVKRESLYHAHTFLVPYTDEYGINGKHFLTKERMLNFHQWFNDQVLDRFGIEYLVHELPVRKTVEELKAKQELEELQKQLKDAYAELKAVRESIDKVNEIKLKKKPFQFLGEYANYRVDYVEKLEKEVEYYRQALNEIDMKRQFEQDGEQKYLSALVEREIANGQNVRNKRNLARIQRMEQKLNVIVEEEAKRIVDELCHYLRYPEKKVERFRDIADSFIEQYEVGLDVKTEHEFKRDLNDLIEDFER